MGTYVFLLVKMENNPQAENKVRKDSTSTFERETPLPLAFVDSAALHLDRYQRAKSGLSSAPSNSQ